MQRAWTTALRRPSQRCPANAVSIRQASPPRRRATARPAAAGAGPVSKRGRSVSTSGQPQQAKVVRSRARSSLPARCWALRWPAFATRAGTDRFLLLPGDDVKITFPTAGMPPKAVSDTFTIVDFYESKMSEYDANFVFVPIRKLQELRGMIDPQTGIGNVTAIQIKLKPGADADAVCNKLRAAFPELTRFRPGATSKGRCWPPCRWKRAILNILLFMIIAVAGFGILAIFFMIVVEKTRDIGILKSLGASSQRHHGHFLGLRPVAGHGRLGRGHGDRAAVRALHQHDSQRLLDWLTGQQVFDPAIYYFYKIPTIVEPATVAWIVGGALVIAVMASILPALRAALLHPVEACAMSEFVRLKMAEQADRQRAANRSHLLLDDADRSVADDTETDDDRRGMRSETCRRSGGPRFGSHRGRLSKHRRRFRSIRPRRPCNCARCT